MLYRVRTFFLEMRIDGGEFPPEKLFGSCWAGLYSLCLLEGTAGGGGWGGGADKVDGVIYKLDIVVLEFTRPLCFLLLLLLCNYYT